MRSLLRTMLSAVVVVGALAAGCLVAAPAAHAAPGDRLSLAYQPSDFGLQKTGTTVRKTFSVTNDGTDPVTIDPAKFTVIAAPFAPVSTTIVPGGTVNPGETRTLTVDFTAGSVGSNWSQSVPLRAVSTVDATVVGDFAFVLRGESIATDPASFEIVDPAAGGVLDFGLVPAGTSVTRTIVVRNDGVLELTFDSALLSIVDPAGNPLPVAFGGTPFMKQVLPGETVGIDVVFTPVGSGESSGVITLTGVYAEDGKVVASATRTLSTIGRASAPAVVPVTPTGSAAAPGVTPAAAPPTPQLARTGADAVGGFVGLTVALMMLLAGTAGIIERRLRRRV